MEENIQKTKKAPLIYAIVGVMTLVIAVAGSTYAFYTASTTNTTSVTGTAGGGEGPEMLIENESDGANGNLIPIDMTTDMLSAAAKGSSKTGNIPCLDSNGYTACQIYSVVITNNANTAQSYNISLTSLSGDDTPNIEAVTMNTSDDTVTSADSIKGVDKGICTTEQVAAGGQSTPCYFMVFIKNLPDDAQTDSGVFNGTVTAVSTTGARTEADFS